MIFDNNWSYKLGYGKVILYIWDENKWKTSIISYTKNIH